MYGWGWGFPTSWQGWATLIVYGMLLITHAFLFPPEEQLAPFLAYTDAISIALIVVCVKKGEPTQWRWGTDREN